MSFFDQLFFNVFNHLKKGRYKKSANDIAMFYITLVQGSFLLVLGVFFAEFFNQMKSLQWLLQKLGYCLVLRYSYYISKIGCNIVAKKGKY